MINEELLIKVNKSPRVIYQSMSKYMQLELKKINRRIEKAKRRLKNPKYTESESEVIDRLTLKKLEILGQ